MSGIINKESNYTKAGRRESKSDELSKTRITEYFTSFDLAVAPLMLLLLLLSSSAIIENCFKINKIGRKRVRLEG